jgi:hypothetical protein
MVVLDVFFFRKEKHPILENRLSFFYESMSTKYGLKYMRNILLARECLKEKTQQLAGTTQQAKHTILQQTRQTENNLRYQSNKSSSLCCSLLRSKPALFKSESPMAPSAACPLPETAATDPLFGSVATCSGKAVRSVQVVNK